jgi:hypothetical protein
MKQYPSDACVEVQLMPSMREDCMMENEERYPKRQKTASQAAITVQVPYFFAVSLVICSVVGASCSGF